MIGRSRGREKRRLNERNRERAKVERIRDGVEEK